MAPPMALPPYKVPWGPFNTSMRSISTSSGSAAPVKLVPMVINEMSFR